MTDKEFISAMELIVAAFKEKGYNPYEQLTGYVRLNNPSYIESLLQEQSERSILCPLELRSKYVQK